MSRTPNLLSVYQSLSALDESDVLVPIDNYPTDWTIDNGTITVSALEKKYLTHYTLLIRPTNTTDPVVLRLNDVEITDIFNSHTISLVNYAIFGSIAEDISQDTLYDFLNFDASVGTGYNSQVLCDQKRLRSKEIQKNV